MRLFQLSLLLILLVGCRSVLDPAPYTPNTDTFVLNSSSPSYTSVNVLQFSTLKDAEAKLQALSNGYASERNNLMRQQLIFDIPMIGLAIATVTAGIYHGSKGSILGLGISTATIAGGRLYFGPQTKVTAYNTAAFALSCASSVAGEMANVQDTLGSRENETS